MTERIDDIPEQIDRLLALVISAIPQQPTSMASRDDQVYAALVIISRCGLDLAADSLRACIQAIQKAEAMTSGVISKMEEDG
jgi:hypothetical protein